MQRPMGVGMPGPSLPHGLPETQILQSIDHMEQHFHQIKSAIQDTLLMLEMQDKAPYQDIMDNFAALAADFSNAQGLLSKSFVPSRSLSDNGKLLKEHILVPSVVSMQMDERLLALTENRIASFNHEVVPNYLRTQMAQHVHGEKGKMESDSQMKASDQISKQIQALNKHVESVSQMLETARQTTTQNTVSHHAHLSAKEDTKTLVMALMRGVGLRPKLASAPSMGAAPPMQPGGGGPMPPNVGVPTGMPGPPQQKK